MDLLYSYDSSRSREGAWAQRTGLRVIPRLISKSQSMNFRSFCQCSSATRSCQPSPLFIFLFVGTTAVSLRNDGCCESNRVYTLSLFNSSLPFCPLSSKLPLSLPFPVPSYPSDSFSVSSLKRPLSPLHPSFLPMNGSENRKTGSASVFRLSEAD